MTITASSFKTSGVVNYEIGRHFDDAATPALKAITVGFSPKKVRWVNLTDRIEWEWQVGVANGTSLKTVAAGTRTLDTADVAISVMDASTGSAPTVVKGANVVTIAAAVILQNKQYQYEVTG